MKKPEHYDVNANQPYSTDHDLGGGSSSQESADTSSKRDITQGDNNPTFNQPTQNAGQAFPDTERESPKEPTRRSQAHKSAAVNSQPDEHPYSNTSSKTRRHEGR